MLGRGLVMACPVCGARKLFPSLVRMVDDCPRCGLHFERIEGHWIGAIGINTIVSFGLLAITLIVGLILTYPDGSVPLLITVAVSVAVVVPTLFYPASKTVWTAIDVAMRPLEPDEIDWSVLASSQETP